MATTNILQAFVELVSAGLSLFMHLLGLIVVAANAGFEYDFSDIDGKRPTAT